MASTTQVREVMAARRPTLHLVWVGLHFFHKIKTLMSSCPKLPQWQLKLRPAVPDLEGMQPYTVCPFEFPGKQQKQSKANSRKSKSPNLGQAYSGGERPSSVSSVHSEGDYHRQAQAQPQWNWEDRPSSTGESSCFCRLRKVFSCKTQVGAVYIHFINTPSFSVKDPCSSLTTR